MGKGDRKTRRGKLFKGSYGVRRKGKKRKIYKSKSKLQEKVSEPRTEASVAKPSKMSAASKKTTVKKKGKDDKPSEEAQ